MIVRRDDLRPEGLEVELDLDLGYLSYERDQQIHVSDAFLGGRVLPWEDGLVCEGRLTATVSVPCSRCLEPYNMPVNRSFRLTYLPRPRERTAGPDEIRIPGDEMDVGYLDEERRLDLAALAAEQVYLELPMKPLCDAGCRGLCAVCGSNRNEGPCRCEMASARLDRGH